jgi:hypothetical protein
MIDSIRRLIQGKSRQYKVKVAALHWLDDTWKSKGLIHDFVMTSFVPDTMEKIEPWVTQDEVNKALIELQEEGLAESKELIMFPGISDTTNIFWRKTNA